MRLPRWSFLTRLAAWRDTLGDIHPTADSLPDVYEDTKSPAPRTRKAKQTPKVEDNDEPFALSEDLSDMAARPPGEAVGEEMENAHQAPLAPREELETDSEPENDQPGSKKQVWAKLISAAMGKKAPVPLPGLDLLVPPAKTPHGPDREDREGKGRALMACLKDFDIQGELVRVTPGTGCDHV